MELFFSDVEGYLAEMAERGPNVDGVVRSFYSVPETTRSKDGAGPLYVISSYLREVSPQHIVAVRLRGLCGEIRQKQKRDLEVAAVAIEEVQRIREFASEHGFTLAESGEYRAAQPGNAGY